jgi:hypothetical protein
VKLGELTVVGVPEIVAPLKLKPAGSVPALIDHVYGLVPPVAVRVWLYATPTTPAMSGELDVIDGEPPPDCISAMPMVGLT